MQLREYQQRAITALRAAYQSGKRAPCLVLPTGAGKTVVAAEIIRSAVARGTKVLFLAHRYELLQQTAHKLELAGVFDVRMIQAANVSGNPSSPVTVASVQTLTARINRLPPADLVVLDECHHAPAKTFARLMAAYPNAARLGMTATPQRGDGRPLGDMFDALVVGSTIKELTALGFLVACTPYAPATRLGSKEIAESPSAAYAKHGNGKRAVVFCSTVEHADIVAAEMGGVVIHGGMPAGQRAEILRSKPQILVNCFVLSEGWDDPEVSVCILTRGPVHSSTFLQMVGRILRPFPGKDRAILIDLCGSVHLHGTPDADRVFKLDGKGIEIEEQKLRQCPACGAVFAGARCECGYAPEVKPFEMPSNLGIGVHKIGSIPAPAFTIPMNAKFASTCRKCKRRIEIGERIFWTKGEKARHAECNPGDAIAAADALLRGVQ